MKTFAALCFVGLIVALSCDEANAVKCYVGALGAYQPQDGCKTCAKYRYSAGGQEVTASACAETCQEGEGQYTGITANVYCCSTDLCNGAESVRIGLPVALAVAVAALWALWRQ